MGANPGSIRKRWNRSKCCNAQSHARHSRRTGGACPRPWRQYGATARIRERFMNRIVTTLFMVFFMGIPIWIRVISFKQWRPFVRMIVIAAMCLFSIGFCIYFLVNTPETLSNFTVWFRNIVLVVYLLAVAISTYFSWPRKPLPEEGPSLKWRI